VFWHYSLSVNKGIWPVKSCMLVVTIWLEHCTSYRLAPVVTTTSIILSSHKIQNWDILVPTYPGCRIENKWRCRIVAIVFALHACMINGWRLTTLSITMMLLVLSYLVLYDCVKCVYRLDCYYGYCRYARLSICLSFCNILFFCTVIFSWRMNDIS